MRCLRWAIAAASLAIAASAVLASCGGSDEAPPSHWEQTPTAVLTVADAAPSETPQPPKEFRVAFINLNLYSPLTEAANNTIAGDTFDERLSIVIAQLKAFEPDIVGFNEASWTKEHGSAALRLAKELAMEPIYFRANPWYPNDPKEKSDALVKQVGFEEGELILVRSGRYPIVGNKTGQYVLDPRTSELGERRVALHVVVNGPPTVGEVDVYVTHLTGGGDRVRRLQAADFAVWVTKTRGTGPTIAMIGQSDASGVSTYEFYSNIGLHDAAGKEPIVTCCRESVVGEQAPLTARNDYLMSDRWKPASWSLFGDVPALRADGTALYPSDHNGLMAVFPIPEEPAPAP